VPEDVRPDGREARVVFVMHPGQLSQGSAGAGVGSSGLDFVAARDEAFRAHADWRYESGARMVVWVVVRRAS